MRKSYVGLGIIIFVVLMTAPIWLNLGKASAIEAPEVSLDTPAINAMAEKKCIYDTEYMRDNHMELLADWKVEVVRNGHDVFIAPDGQEYHMSLQNTCLECHSNYEDFCKKCHDYNGVEPNCWTCHVNTPENVLGGGA